jgi:hypothetical protein
VGRRSAKLRQKIFFSESFIRFDGGRFHPEDFSGELSSRDLAIKDAMKDDLVFYHLDRTSGRGVVSVRISFISISRRPIYRDCVGLRFIPQKVILYS